MFPQPGYVPHVGLGFHQLINQVADVLAGIGGAIHRRQLRVPECRIRTIEQEIYGQHRESSFGGLWRCSGT